MTTSWLKSRKSIMKCVLPLCDERPQVEEAGCGRTVMVLCQLPSLDRLRILRLGIVCLGRPRSHSIDFGLRYQPESEARKTSPDGDLRRVAWSADMVLFDKRWGTYLRALLALFPTYRSLWMPLSILQI